MTGSIGLGLILNVLFWTAAVLVVVGLASLAVIEWFPGREAGARGVAGASRGPERAATRAAKPGTDDRGQGESSERYRKAS